MPSKNYPHMMADTRRYIMMTFKTSDREFTKKFVFFFVFYLELMICRDLSASVSHESVRVSIS